MDFGFSPEEERLIREVRDFIRREATPELLNETLGLGLIYGEKKGGNSFKSSPPRAG